MAKIPSKLAALYKSLHRWPGLILSVVLLYYSVTGIFMNHREFFSGIDVSRTFLPENFKYHNWNNSALKGNLTVSDDSIFVYGNIGIWITDSAFVEYRPCNAGFPQGMDNRKILDMHRSADGNLYAATHFGLFAYSTELAQWQKFPLDVDIERFVAVESVGDTVFALSRSYLFKGQSDGLATVFERYELPEPAGYENKLSLFQTIWQIHSGEILGLPGKLFVDFLGIVTIFLSITGIIYFFFPGWIKKRKQKSMQIARLANFNRWSLKWHNHIGAWTFIPLTVLFFSGIFLRPPVLIAIAYTDVAPVKYSHLDQPNPWYDKLRDMLYDTDRNILLLSTSAGMYYMPVGTLHPTLYANQPPVSVMGISSLERLPNGAYMVGSFSGMFLWHPARSQIYNYAQGTIYRGNPSGRPIGDYKITGHITDTEGKRYMIDYDKGVIAMHHSKQFPPMPQNVLDESKMSLWNLSLEIHTGRFFQELLGDFYILIVPLASLMSVTVVLSGYLLWRKRYKGKN